MSELTVVLAAWLIRSLTIGAGVLLVGWLALRGSRAPATRRRIAGATVIAALLVPVLCALPAWVLLPAGPAPAPPATAPEPSSAAVLELPPFEPAWVEAPPAPPRAEVAPTSAVVAESPAPEVAVAFDWRVPFLFGFAAVFLVLFGQLVRGHLALSRLWRDSRPLPGRIAAWLDDSRVDVRVSDRVASAICFGWGRPRVLLPLGFARAATVVQLRWVVAHEFDHARRGDHRLSYFVGLCRAVYFAVPWFWLFRRDLRLAQEFLADAAAARAAPAEYAAFLVELISTAGPVRPGRTALAATGVGGSDLYRRVTMLLDSRPNPRRASRLLAAVVGMAVIVSAVVASGLGVQAAPNEDPPEREKAKPADPIKAAPKPLPADPDEVRPIDPRELQKKIAEMMRRGNADQEEIRRMMTEMSRQMMEQNRRMMENMRQQMGLGVFPFQGQPNGFGPFVNPAAVAKAPLREQYEKRLKQFDDDIAKNADNKEAQAALTKAREAYVEAMAAELKKADEEAAKQGQPFFPDFKPLIGADVEFMPFPAFPGQNAFPGADPFAGRVGGVRQRQSVLGVAVEKLSPALAEQLDLPADKGVVVAAVAAGSPAEKAGLKKNDVLVKVAGQDVPGDAAAFAALVTKLKAGEKFDADVIRKGKKETVKGIELPKPAEPPARGRLEADRLLPGGRLEADRINFNQMQVQVNNGDVSINATLDGVTYVITGTAANGPVVPDKIVIDDGGKKEYPSLDKVPEKHRAAVAQLLGQGRGFRR